MDIKDTNILVTGGSGLIGSTTIDILRREFLPGQNEDGLRRLVAWWQANRKEVAA